MKPQRSSIAWAVGILVLIAVAVTLALVFRGRSPAASRAGHPTPAAPVAADLTLLPVPAAAPAVPNPPPSVVVARGRRVAGQVRLPSGRPAAGATVVACRAFTAWPEWRREPLFQAITGSDGSFEFAVDPDFEILLEYQHPAWAGGLVDVPRQGERLELPLQPGFTLTGIVTNDVGSPVANARVAVEAVLADSRRAVVTATATTGRFQFTNLPAGPVRVVARHPQWQPAVVPAVVVGATSLLNLTFDRPALPALRGRVLGAGQAPVAGAAIELLPPNVSPGLADPIVVLSEADGSFALPGLARGTLQALVRHPEHGALTRTLAIGSGSGELLFELPPRTRVTGRLAADGLAPVLAGLRLLLQDGSGELVAATVAADGRFSFPGTLSPGSATLTLLGGSYAFQRSAAQSVSVRLAESRSTDLELPLVAATTLQGRVVDEQGQPLAGVVIRQTRALLENARFLSSAAAAWDVGAFGSQLANLVADERDRVLAVSGEDGRFLVRGEAPGLLLVRFDVASRGSRWLRIEVPPAPARGDFGDVPLVPGGRLVGKVLRGTTALAGAAVSYVGKEAQGTVSTDRTGTFRVDDLQPGEYRIRARLPSMPTANVETTVVVTAGAPTQAGELVLQPGRQVRGLVTGSDGQPVAGALVTVRGANGQPTVTDPSGRFLLELPPRAVELVVALGDRSVQSSVRVARNQDEVAVSLATKPTCTLVAAVYGLPGRKRPPGALLRLQVLDAEGDGTPRARWVEMVGGTLRWPLCPTGRVRVEVRCDGYAPWSTEADFVANEEHSLGEVLLEPGCRLVGKVVAPDGSAVGNAALWLGDEADLDLFEPATRSASDGTFRITGVTTRSAGLVVRAPGFATTAVVLRLPMDVLADAPYEVTLQRGSTIEVELPRLREGSLVQLQRDGRVLASAEVDETRRVRFEHRAPGVYSVRLFGSDEPPRVVKVERSGDTVLVTW